jgi:L,D-peptidoglycan transpeptidase YkuD (ErfK/YbiS/YcfS/YnhG family)
MSGRVLVLLLIVAGLAGCQAPPAAHAAAPPVATTAPAATPAPTTAAPTPTPTPAPTVAPRPATLADRLTSLPANTTQVVIVHGDSYSTTYATLEAYQKSGGHWQLAFPPMAARIGQRGFTDTPAEGTPATPTGVYPFGATLYGNSPDPGAHYPYHRLVVGDYWDENADSPTYNTFVHGANPGGPSEPLWESPTAYSYFAFIAYNVPAIPGKGSAIFLHQSLDKSTAGCVALPQADLLRVLRWLNPAAHPRIVLGPDSVLSRY